MLQVLEDQPREIHSEGEGDWLAKERRGQLDRATKDERVLSASPRFSSPSLSLELRLTGDWRNTLYSLYPSRPYHERTHRSNGVHEAGNRVAYSNLLPTAGRRVARTRSRTKRGTGFVGTEGDHLRCISVVAGWPAIELPSTDPAVLYTRSFSTSDRATVLGDGREPREAPNSRAIREKRRTGETFSVLTDRRPMLAAWLDTAK